MLHIVVFEERNNLHNFIGKLDMNLEISADIKFLPSVGEKHEPLSWDLRVYIALDVARGLEYLHDGVKDFI